VELFGALNKLGKELHESPINATQLGALLDLLAGGTISGKIAKQVFATMLETGENPDAIVAREGLVQVSDTGAILAAVQQVIAENTESVAKFKAGNERLFGFFVGQVMKATQGKANPAIVNELITQELTNHA